MGPSHIREQKILEVSVLGIDYPLVSRAFDPLSAHRIDHRLPEPYCSANRKADSRSERLREADPVDARV